MPITLITAPAGSGKTTAMVQAFHDCRQRGQAAGWASLDYADNDTTGLIALLVSALRMAAPNACTATAILLETGLMPPEAVLQRTLLNEIADLRQDMVVFLDDYHCITDARVVELMNLLLEANTQHLRFLIASRNQHNLSIARLRMLGLVRELTFQDLQFDPDETQRVLRLWGHGDVTENQSDLLRQKTEGWVAGLQLASIALANEADKGHFINAFSGTNKRIDGFISDEVFQKHPEAVRDFLLNTAILERFTLDLCNAVNPGARNFESLDYIEQWNLFLVPLDDERMWFRYHHLFNDYLRRKLTELHRERVPHLHRTAARWLFDNGMITEAIGHAFASGDHEFAGQLLDEGSDALFSAGRAMTLESYARRLSDAHIRRLPRLLLDRAWQSELRWRFREAEADLRDARIAVQTLTERAAGSGGGPDLAYLREKLSHREMMLKLLNDDNAGARADAQAWLESRYSNDMFMYASSLSAQILTDREFFRFDLVMSRAEEVREMFMRHGAFYGTVFHDSIVGRSLQRCGRLDEAVTVLDRSLAMAVKLHGAFTPLASMPTSLLASIAYERGDVAEARRLLAGYLPLSKELGFVDNMMEAFFTSIRLAFIDRDFAQVGALLDEADCAATQFGFDRFKGLVLLQRFRLAALDPFFARGIDTLDLSPLPAEFDDPWSIAQPSSRHETAALVHCERLIAAGKARAAAAILQRWLRFATHRQAKASVAAIAALLARALVRDGDVEGAQRLLVDVLKAMTHARFVRSFADQGPVLAPVLTVVRNQLRDAHPAVADYAGAILAAIGADGTRRHAVADAEGAALCEPLTGREIEILRLADDGLSNGEIAAALSIAESTVKWYWQRIFDKVAARGRRHAIRTARTLGVIGLR
ncbi:LuxR C-terminal-related transcriptional regulator [Zavarzinia compransoris]|uniref:LuxR C-terminal-related transcriptional regulator n=1 Tax=Zavarzinia marina TaxID=2911065 RepID=UPI001F20DD3E|nr:LuxR C-terminal-related transcriptional regulator [Zavarzinia marina]MCF4167014.1 LuxR C-terminal-related transcriptional regulator [Zavarzinia marina]